MWLLFGPLFFTLCPAGKELKRKVNITFLQNNAFSKNHAGVRKLGQSVSRHQNILSFFVLWSLLLDRRSWSALPAGQGIDVLFLLKKRERRTFFFSKKKKGTKKEVGKPAA